MGNLQIYTIVLHALKNHLGLTDNEYYVVDTIDYLSKKSGWCYKSKCNIADDLFISERTVNQAIKRLMSLGLIQKKVDNPKYIKPTSLWIQTKKEFENKLGESYTAKTEDNEVKYRKPNNTTTQVFPKTQKDLRTRMTKEKQIENKELNRTLDKYLNF